MSSLFRVCLFVSFFIFSGYSHGFIQHLATPAIDAENATQALKNKKAAEQMIQGIQQKHDEQQRQLDCLNDNQSDSTSENDQDNPCD